MNERTTRPLGATGLRVSRVGLGTVKLGRNEKVKYPQQFDLPSDAAVEALLEGALERGVRLFDTAPAYGTSEERLRPFVQRHRDEIVLVSKAGERFEGGQSTYDFSAAAIRTSVEASLRRLGTDHLDVLLLHSDGRDAEILEHSGAPEELARLRDEGKLRAIGISLKTVRGIELAARDLDVVMAPFSLDHLELGEALAAAHAAGVGVLGIKGLGSGHLARGGVSAAEAARHVLDQPFIDTLVLGTLSLEHLDQIIRVASEES